MGWERGGPVGGVVGVEWARRVGLGAEGDRLGRVEGGVGPSGTGGSAGTLPLRPQQLLKRRIVPQRLELVLPVWPIFVVAGKPFT